MAFVTRVLFDGTRASGVEAIVDGEPTALEASREVILCAGAYQSPQLLMLSGIGPADELPRSASTCGSTSPRSAATSRTT